MDPKLLYWCAALVNLGVIAACVAVGIARIRAGDVRRHRALMLAAAGLVGLFLVSYAAKVVALGREDRSAWTPLDYAVLYVHETCVAVMLVAGALAAWKAWRFRGALGPGPSRPATPLPGGDVHRRAGWAAVVGTGLAFLTAGGVLWGMFARAGETALARNMVLVSLDTLRADHLGVYGYARDTSPALDAWAADAFVFERATSPANATQGAHHAIFQSRPASAAIAGRDRSPTLAAILRERGYRTAGFTDGGTMAAALGFDRGFEHYDDANRGLADSVPEALRFLERVAAEDAPFYLFVHTFDVHLPYDPPAPYDARFPPTRHPHVSGATTVPLLRGVRRIFTQARRERPVRLGPRGRRRVVALYDGEIAKTDALLAPLLARASAPDLRDDTIVVVLSDHGEEFWDHGSVLHSHTLYQELLHVPLLLRVPPLADRVRRIPERVSTLDVLPTVLDLLGVPAPPALHGRSLVPLLVGGTLPPVPALAEGYPFGSRLQSVTDGRYKLIRSLETGAVQLYDLVDDPRERHDLAAALPERVATLSALLDAGLGADATPSEDPVARPETLDEATRERLRELGYID